MVLLASGLGSLPLLCSSQESGAPKSLGAENCSSNKGVIHGADAPWLDSCDRYGNEGWQDGHRLSAVNDRGFGLLHNPRAAA
jgi:hypothetical protein